MGPFYHAFSPPQLDADPKIVHFSPGMKEVLIFVCEMEKLKSYQFVAKMHEVTDIFDWKGFLQWNDTTGSYILGASGVPGKSGEWENVTENKVHLVKGNGTIGAEYERDKILHSAFCKVASPASEEFTHSKTQTGL